jgi:hypothetical protein
MRRATPPPHDLEEDHRMLFGDASSSRLIESVAALEPEALGATLVAAAVVRDLHESGREVRFALVPTSARVTVLLCDTNGAVLSRLSPARALEIAAGGSVLGSMNL